MTTIIGVDLGTKFGVTIGDDKGNVHSLHHCKLKTSKKNPGLIWINFQREYGNIIQGSCADLVVYERVYRFMSSSASIRYGGLLAHLEFMCQRDGVDIAYCSPTEWKRFAVGKGNASKEEVARMMIAELGRERFAEFGSEIPDDLTDSLGIYRWAVANIKKNRLSKPQKTASF